LVNDSYLEKKKFTKEIKVISFLGSEKRESEAAGIFHNCGLEHGEGNLGDQSGSGQMVLSSFNISRL
jgi:hypothetical protein